MLPVPNLFPVAYWAPVSGGYEEGTRSRHTDVMDSAIAPHFATSALVTIDTQVDTLDGQPMEIPGTSAVIPNITTLCRAFRDAARPIVHVVRLYLADGSNAEPARRNLVTGSTPVLRPASPGRLLAPGLAPEGAARLDDDLLLSGQMQQLAFERGRPVQTTLGRILRYAPP